MAPISRVMLMKCGEYKEAHICIHCCPDSLITGVFSERCREKHGYGEEWFQNRVEEVGKPMESP